MTAIKLSDEERRALLATWAAQQVGICPPRAWMEARGLREAADAMVARGLLYVVRDAGPSDPGGYHIRGEDVDAHAERLHDASGRTMGYHLR